MSELSEQLGEAVESAGESRLNSVIAALVAVFATFMALSNVKAGNVVQGMARDQVAANNQWSLFQSKSTKESFAESAAEQLRIQKDLAGPTASAELLARLDEKIAALDAKVTRYETEKAAIKAKAEEYEADYEKLAVKDDQFDIGEALLSVAISLLGITALTQKKPLLFVALAFGGFGLVVGLSGFMGWNIRPEWLASLIG